MRPWHQFDTYDDINNLERTYEEERSKRSELPNTQRG